MVNLFTTFFTISTFQKLNELLNGAFENIDNFIGGSRQKWFFSWFQNIQLDWHNNQQKFQKQRKRQHCSLRRRQRNRQFVSKDIWIGVGALWADDVMQASQQLDYGKWIDKKIKNSTILKRFQFGTRMKFQTTLPMKGSRFISWNGDFIRQNHTWSVYFYCHKKLSIILSSTVNMWDAFIPDQYPSQFCKRRSFLIYNFKVAKVFSKMRCSNDFSALQYCVFKWDGENVPNARGPREKNSSLRNG